MKRVEVRIDPGQVDAYDWQTLAVRALHTVAQDIPGMPSHGQYGEGVWQPLRTGDGLWFGEWQVFDE